MFKSYILYVVISWYAPPLIENQKTIILQFDNGAECTSIAKQVHDTAMGTLAPFQFKTLQCVPCTQLYGADKCPKTKGKR